jgi:hypothetical protein
MLRVSIHAGPLRDINRFNRVDWLDIGYDKLDAAANYKIVLFNVGEGATPVIPLLNYPRWSASLWDLTARAIALALSPDPKNRKEEVDPVEPRGKRYAYAREVSVVIQHLPNAGLRIRNVGSMQIRQCSVTKGFYQAQIEEDLMPSITTKQFAFMPKFLRPAELVMRTALVGLTGSFDKMPPRPPAQLPTAEEIDGRPQVAIHKIPEPARTGFIRWLYEIDNPPQEYADMPEGIAPESHFVEFLEKAV